MLQVGLGLNMQTGDQFAEEQRAGGAAPQGQRENGGASAPAREEKPSVPAPQPAAQPLPEQSEEEKVTTAVR